MCVRWWSRFKDSSHQCDALPTDTPPARFYVPDPFFIECTNILWKYVRRFDYPAEAAQQDVVDLTRLPLQSVSTAALASDALPLAVEYGSTTYDAAYVALARRLSLPLVTADDALVRRFVETDHSFRSLGDWPT